MADHLHDLRAFMNIAGTNFTPFQQDAHNAQIPVEATIQVAPDEDSVLESLELLRFKLINHRQMTGSSDYALGYEEACMKVVEMIDGILRNHQLNR